MRSQIELHALMRAIYRGQAVTNLRKFVAVLEYWQRVRGSGD